MCSTGADARPYRLVRAIERGQLTAAEAAARECKQVGLAEALGICLLMARDGDPRFERGAVRWLSRLLDDEPAIGPERAADLARALADLAGVAPDVARARLALVLRACGLEREAAVAEAGRL